MKIAGALPARVRAPLRKLKDAWPRLGAFVDRQRPSTFVARVHRGDSRTFLSRMVSELAGRRCLFYLDALWCTDLPLADELRIVARGWKEWVVIVDDFRVDDDPKYYYDDYGPGRTLEFDYLPLDDIAPCEGFYTKATGLEESYRWRGCIVLARDDDVIGALRQCSTLRPARPTT